MKNVMTHSLKDIRSMFPILDQKVNGHDLVYLDNAATTQKPLSVINALTDYYRHDNANIHRGIHTLAERATKAYEQTRETVQHFINARHPEEIIFTRGVTEGINLVASSYGRAFLREGDEIILSGLEHHSNIVPWQMISEEKKAHIRVIPVKENGELDLEKFAQLLGPKTKVVAVNHASNSLGTINPIKKIIEMARETNAIVCVDGAQAGAHLAVDVQALDCDFYFLSAHKMYGPTGTGVLYGKKDILEAMPPYQGGGEMIRDVSFEKTTYNDLPYKFEAGTPNIADVVAFRHAIDFILEMGREKMEAHEKHLLAYATTRLSQIKGLRLIGTAPEKVSVVSFALGDFHPFDVGQMLDTRGIAVRTGHHCTQPLMDRLKIEGTIRASFAVYNSTMEIDQLAEALERINQFKK